MKVVIPLRILQKMGSCQPTSMMVSEFVKRRRQNFSSLYNGLEDLKDKLILPEPCEGSNPCWFGFLLTCKEGIDRNYIVQMIEGKGVQTRMLFAGNIIKHPCFDEMRKQGQGYRVAGDLINTDRIMKDSFWIGVYPGMTDEMLDYMIQCIREAVEIR